MSNEKFVLIPISVFESNEWTEKREFSKVEAWLWLLVNANRSSTEQYVRVGKNTFIVQFGQIHITNRTLADVWGWSSSTVNRYLDKLVSDGRIEKINVDSKLGTLISICDLQHYVDIND